MVIAKSRSHYPNRQSFFDDLCTLAEESVQEVDSTSCCLVQSLFDGFSANVFVV